MKTFEKSFIKMKHLGKASAKETFRESFIKAQSAMEYLMTYGWAILIIAIVLSALFELGVFNANNFTPKAPPGACQVFRPNGPGTTSFINLEGECTGELPEYAAQFNGQTSHIILSDKNLPTGSSPRTFTAWVQPSGPNQGGSIVSYGTTSNGEWVIVWLKFISSNALRFSDWGGNAALYTGGITTQNFYFIAVSIINANTIYGAVNSNYTLLTPLTYPVNTVLNGELVIGDQDPPGYIQFNGLIANVQIYNTSLSANEIQALYLEGIGGAPIDLQNLVAWWPLNGNADDYSGNDNNGQISNVNFVSNWYSGYTPP